MDYVQLCSQMRGKKRTKNNKPRTRHKIRNPDSTTNLRRMDYVQLWSRMKGKKRTKNNKPPTQHKIRNPDITTKKKPWFFTKKTKSRTILHRETKPITKNHPSIVNFESSILTWAMSMDTLRFVSILILAYNIYILTATLSFYHIYGEWKQKFTQSLAGQRI